LLAPPNRPNRKTAGKCPQSPRWISSWALRRSLATHRKSVARRTNANCTCRKQPQCSVLASAHDMPLYCSERSPSTYACPQPLRRLSVGSQPTSLRDGRKLRAFRGVGKADTTAIASEARDLRYPGLLFQVYRHAEWSGLRHARSKDTRIIDSFEIPLLSGRLETDGVVCETVSTAIRERRRSAFDLGAWLEINPARAPTDGLNGRELNSLGVFHQRIDFDIDPHGSYIVSCVRSLVKWTLATESYSHSPTHGLCSGWIVNRSNARTVASGTYPLVLAFS